MSRCLTTIGKYSFLLLLLMAIATGCRNNKNTNNTQETEKPTTAIDNHLELIKKRGKLICGINDRLPGFSYKEANGDYSGLSVDLCRAIAAALFNDPTKVEFRHLEPEERFKAIKTGKVDLLSRNTTWTMSRDTAQGLEFPPTNFYDSQGLLVPQDSNIDSLEDLQGKSICVGAKTTSEANIEVQMRKRNIAYSPIAFDDIDLMYTAYEAKNCDAATSDISELAIRRVSLTTPRAHKILDEVLSKEPLGPVIANGEPEWFDVVEWVGYSMIKAEELGINSQNINRLEQSKNPTIQRFLGKSENMGKDLGLSNDFAQRVILQVGNYGEVYDRNIGKPFGLARGVNALWQNGGLIYAPPFR